MYRRMLKNLSLCIVIIMLISMFGGCTRETSTNPDVKGSESPGTPISETPTASMPPKEDIKPVISTPKADDTPQPLDFTWKPHVFSDIYLKVYGEEMQQTFYAMVDAVMTGAESFSCPDEQTMYNIGTVANVCFPPYSILVSGIHYNEGAVYLTYVHDNKKREELLDEFIDQVTNIVMGSGIMEGDSPEVAAILIYHYYSQIIMYDYSATDDDVMVDVSSYRAIGELSGICQSFGAAYAYLCLQGGIDAVITGGLNESFVAHDWTLLTLDGNYYYADPTYENGYGGQGLRYFGMTAAKRESEDGYIAEDYNVGNTNELWGRDIDVTDETFSPLWEATLVESMQRTNDGLKIQCVKEDGTQFEFIVK